MTLSFKISKCKVSKSAESQGDSSEALLAKAVSVLAPPPAVVVLDQVVWVHWLHCGLGALAWQINALEVIVFGFIPVGQVPEEADVFQGEVVPVVVVWIVWYLVVVDVLACAEDAREADQSS